jgi:hypothetical protein
MMGAWLAVDPESLATGARRRDSGPVAARSLSRYPPVFTAAQAHPGDHDELFAGDLKRPGMARR